jgi:hypothetical protein
MTNTQQALARLMGVALRVWSVYPGYGNGLNNRGNGYGVGVGYGFVNGNRCDNGDRYGDGEYCGCETGNGCGHTPRWSSAP